MLHKNEVYEGFVGGVGSDGAGVIKIDGTTVFVPFCVTGEKIKFKILKVKDRVAHGKLEEIIIPSAVRVAPRCPVYGKCGGCNMQHVDYSMQLYLKSTTVANTLLKIGDIIFNVKDTVPSEKEYAYRNKLALPIGLKDGETVVGFYAPHSHRIVPVDDCPIQAEWVKEIISAVKEFAATGVRGYNEESGTGEMRHIVVREVQKKYIITLVCTKKIDLEPFIGILRKKFEEFTLILNINNKNTNAIFGDSFYTVYGDGFFEAEEFGIKYRAGASTFLQVNDGMRTRLYSYVLDETEKGVTAIDLYSGGGLLTAMLAKKCGLAYGIEVVEEASRCAEELKESNGLEGKMINICGRVEDEIDRVIAKAQGKKIIVCDPPRKGIERSAVNAIKHSGADKIIYISCNPATLARDLGLIMGTLTEEDGVLVKSYTPPTDYKVISVTPFDMFPQTHHVETVVVLSRLTPKDKKRAF